MIFNLREAGTEVHEGTMEWHSRMARESETMQFGDPKAQTTDIRDDWTDSLDDSGSTNGGAEVEALMTLRSEIDCSIGRETLNQR